MRGNSCTKRITPERPEIWSRTHCLRLLGAISASALLASCVTSESLSQKEEGARVSGRGVVVGFAEGLRSSDDPVLAKIRNALLEDDLLRRTIQETARASVVGARQGLSDIKIEESAVAFTDAVASALEKHLERSATRILNNFESTAHTTAVRIVQDAVLVAAKSFESASPRVSAGMRNIVEASTHAFLRVVTEGLDKRLQARTREFLDDELPRAAGMISRVAAREAVGGFKEGMGKEFPLFLPEVREGADWVRIMLISGLIVLLALLLVTGIVLTQLFRSYRMGQQALSIVAQKVDQHGSPELKAAIHETASRNGIESWLKEFLRGRGL